MCVSGTQKFIDVLLSLVLSVGWQCDHAFKIIPHHRYVCQCMHFTDGRFLVFFWLTNQLADSLLTLIELWHVSEQLSYATGESTAAAVW